MKTPFKIPLLLLLFCCILTFSAYAQVFEEPDTVVIVTAEEDSFIYQSPVRIDLEAISVVRFGSNARAYLRWSPPSVASTGYTVRYKLLGASSWTTSSNSTLNKTLTSLQLDTSYSLEILPYGVTDASKYQGIGTISTRPQNEPIVVSHEMFNALTGWFTYESETRTFCEYMDAIDLNLFEKLAFLQKYAFDNEAFSDGGSSTDFSDWYPSRFSGLDGNACLPEWETKCRCNVISDGSNHASPGETDDPTVTIKPKIVQKIAKNGNKRTYIDRFEGGAAKFIGLRQDEARGMEYEMSNVGSADDPTAATPAVSEIQFFLGCLDRDEGGGINTNLPAECDCERPLHVSYDYSTRLIAMAEKKGCAWSKGAAAQAEDVALVVALDVKTGNLTALDAGTYMVSRRCDSAWNPNWWINLLDVVESVAGYYVYTLDTTHTNIPTGGQLDTFFDALQVLIGTPFSIQSGSCGTTESAATLVHGSNNLTLLPNRPIRISMFSAYYAKVRGYGCWKAEAGIASDYYLLGVVESEQTENPECCADKFATYIVGSLQSDSQPEPLNPSHVELDAPHTIDDRLDAVGTDLALYGTWDCHPENPHTGTITDLVYEYDLLHGISCDLVDPLQRPEINYPVLVQNASGLVRENLTMDIQTQVASTGIISIFDMSGRLIKTLYSGQFSSGLSQMDFDLSNLSNGSYILYCNIEGRFYSYPILVFNN